MDTNSANLMTRVISIANVVGTSSSPIPVPRVICGKTLTLYRTWKPNTIYTGRYEKCAKCKPFRPALSAERSDQFGIDILKFIGNNFAPRYAGKNKNQ